MSIQDIIRAWKDADYRDSLSDAQRALLPAHPGGLIELSDKELGGVGGALPPAETQDPSCNWTEFYWCGSLGTCGTGTGYFGCTFEAACP